jgi:hypothetical protein
MSERRVFLLALAIAFSAGAVGYAVGRLLVAAMR